MKRKLLLFILGIVFLEALLRIGGFLYLETKEWKSKDDLHAEAETDAGYRIMTLGESTTADESGNSPWPGQLEEILNSKSSMIIFKVINKAVDGVTTHFLMATLEESLDKYKPNMVVAMMGANDNKINFVLKYDRKSESAFSSIFKGLRIYKLVRLLWNSLTGKAYGAQATPSLSESTLSQTESNNEWGYIDAGRSFVKHRNCDGAEEMFRRAMEINPENQQIYTALGECYESQGDHGRAEEMYKKALEINPENDLVYIEVGKSYLNERYYEKAEEMFRKALEINPENDWAYLEVGRCYLYKGDTAYPVDSAWYNM